MTGKHIEPDDKIIGISSSGIHSNGYTLARKIIKKMNLKYTDNFPGEIYKDKTIGEIFLTPTRIYVKEIVNLLKNIKPKGLSHITGGGLKNLKRLKKDVKYVINDPFEPQDIFKFLQKNGNVSNKEMYQTFNMGMGFAVIVSEEKAMEATRTLKKYSQGKVKKVGEITEGKGVEFQKLDLKY
ncbi:MAG: AIR synthase-related protein [Candidatus Thermoplasmatota archaeon]